MKKTPFLIPICLLFSNCGYYHEKMAEIYLKKAEKISLSREASKEEIDSVYEYLSRAIDHKPDLPRALEIAERTAQASVAGGYTKPAMLNMEIINKYLKANPDAWQVYLNLISAYSINGDLLGLEGLISKFYSMQNMVKPEERITLKILIAICHYNLVSWLKSEGYLSVNAGADKLLENLNRFANHAEKAIAIRNEIKKEEPATSSVDREIMYAYEISLTEAFKDENEISRILRLNDLIKQNPSYLKSVKYTADGNVFLYKKEYANARLYYKAALSNYPEFINARKQLIETDFQEAMTEALSKQDMSAIKETLYDCDQEITEMIQDMSSLEVTMPFVTTEKFLSEAYSLKAAILTAIMTVGDVPPQRKEKIKKQISAALDKAIELYPKNKMAKEIFERIRKNDK